ncbi:hypothetical protein ABPG72_013921 [Tetrahymena utriculariae]
MAFQAFILLVNILEIHEITYMCESMSQYLALKISLKKVEIKHLESQYLILLVLKTKHHKFSVYGIQNKNMRKQILILLVLFFTSQFAKSDYDTVTDDDSFIMEIIRQHDPEGKLLFSKETYFKVLRDIIAAGMSLAGQNFNEEKILLLIDAIHDFVESKPDDVENKLTYKDVFEDLTSKFVIFLQENIQKYQVAFEMMYGEPEILPPINDEEGENENQKNNSGSVDDL